MTASGQVLDRIGNVQGLAERWEPEAEPEPEVVDLSILAGKRVNKGLNVVDNSGAIYGRVVEGDPKKVVGRMANKLGQIVSESGDIIGRAELVNEGEREGLKEGPFADIPGCTVVKDGTVVSPSGNIVGRLISGDPKILAGRSVDEDGDVLDKNGNSIGRAERWEPEEKEKAKHPAAGCRVSKSGEVYRDSSLIAKLTSGDLQVCANKEIDDDGDVLDGKGTVVGHATLLEDLQEETETEDEKAQRERSESDKKLGDSDGGLHRAVPR